MKTPASSTVGPIRPPTHGVLQAAKTYRHLGAWDERSFALSVEMGQLGPLTVVRAPGGRDFISPLDSPM